MGDVWLGSGRLVDGVAFSGDQVLYVLGAMREMGCRRWRRKDDEPMQQENKEDKGKLVLK